jgi:hypothetical protein
MRYAAMFLAAATLSGCGGEVAGPSTVTERAGPSAEAPSTDTTSNVAAAAPERTFLWGMVVQENGICILGASARVVSGQAEGQAVVQETSCDAWSFGGFMFKDLTPGVAMTIRASAPGYVSKDVTVVPYVRGLYTVMLIELTSE